MPRKLMRRKVGKKYEKWSEMKAAGIKKERDLQRFYRLRKNVNKWKARPE